MGTKTGRRKLILMLRFPDRRDQVPFAVGVNSKFQALLHLRHTSRHLLLCPRVDNSFQLLIYLIPVLRSQSPHVPPWATLPMLQCDYVPASARTNPTGKVLNSGRAWSTQGQRMFGTANNKDVLYSFRTCFSRAHGYMMDDGTVRSFIVIISCYYDLSCYKGITIHSVCLYRQLLLPVSPLYPNTLPSYGFCSLRLRPATDLWLPSALVRACSPELGTCNPLPSSEHSPVQPSSPIYDYDIRTAQEFQGA